MRFTPARLPVSPLVSHIDIGGETLTEHIQYERPTITEIGTLHDLTLAAKFLNSSDGDTIGGVPIGPTGVSVIIGNPN
jgi:hypothetical protein